MAALAASAIIQDFWKVFEEKYICIVTNQCNPGSQTSAIIQDPWKEFEQKYICIVTILPTSAIIHSPAKCLNINTYIRTDTKQCNNPGSQQSVWTEIYPHWYQPVQSRIPEKCLDRNISALVSTSAIQDPRKVFEKKYIRTDTNQCNPGSQHSVWAEIYPHWYQPVQSRMPAKFLNINVSALITTSAIQDLRPVQYSRIPAKCLNRNISALLPTSAIQDLRPVQ